MVGDTKKNWNDFDVTKVEIQNYGDTNMQVLVEGEMEFDQKFTAIGKRIYKVATAEIIAEKNPLAQSSYLDSVKKHFISYSLWRLRWLWLKNHQFCSGNFILFCDYLRSDDLAGCQR